MWKCNNCGEEITRDKYKHCWNCGKPKPAFEDIEKTKISSEVTNIIEETLVENEPEIKFEAPPKIEQPVTASPLKVEVFSDFEPQSNENKSSFIGKIIPVFLWLAVVAAIGYFAYSTYQKSKAFDEKVNSEVQVFNNQKAQFVFPPIPPMRRGTIIEGCVKPKVLPLKVKTNEIENLFSYLPDDLRPTNIDEIKTMMWFDCQNNPISRYQDGTTGYQEKCTVYLVEKETSKFIGIQDFLGVMPALTKEGTGNDAIGRVLPEKYVAFLREKQVEAERGIFQSASESPDHHYFSKSEFIYALLLLGFLVAIGFGWLAYKIKFDWRAE